MAKDRDSSCPIWPAQSQEVARGKEARSDLVLSHLSSTKNCWLWSLVPPSIARSQTSLLKSSSYRNLNSVSFRFTYKKLCLNLGALKLNTCSCCMKKILTWAKNPIVYKSPLSGVVALCCLAEGTGSELGRLLGVGLTLRPSLQSTAPLHCSALPPLLCYTWQAPRRISWWLEKGMASPSSPGVRGKVEAKPMTTQREGMKANWVNRMGPSPPPDPPSHNWDFLLGRLWFSSHLNLVWSCSMVYLVKAEIQHEKWNDK